MSGGQFGEVESHWLKGPGSHWFASHLNVLHNFLNSIWGDGPTFTCSSWRPFVIVYIRILIVQQHSSLPFHGPCAICIITKAGCLWPYGWENKTIIVVFWQLLDSGEDQSSSHRASVVAEQSHSCILQRISLRVHANGLLEMVAVKVNRTLCCCITHEQEREKWNTSVRMNKRGFVSVCNKCQTISQPYVIELAA